MLSNNNGSATGTSSSSSQSKETRDFDPLTCNSFLGIPFNPVTIISNSFLNAAYTLPNGVFEKLKENMKRQILPLFASYLGRKEEDLVCFSEDIKRLDEPSSILQDDEYNKNDMFFWYYRGLILFYFLGENQKALACLDKAIEIANKETDGVYWMADRSSLLKIDGSNYFNEDFKKNLWLSFVFNPIQADIFLLRGFIKKESNNEEFKNDLGLGFYLYGLSCSIHGEHPFAIKAFHLAIESFAFKNADVFYQLGHSYWCMGERKKAIEQYELAIKTRPSGVNILKYIKIKAQANYEVGNFTESLTDVTRFSVLHGQKYSSPGVVLSEKEIDGELVKSIDYASLDETDYYFDICILQCKLYYALKDKENWSNSCLAALHIHTIKESSWIVFGQEIIKQAEHFLSLGISNKNKEQVEKSIDIIEKIYEKILEINERDVSRTQLKNNIGNYTDIFRHYVTCLLSKAILEYINPEIFKKKLRELVRRIRKQKDIEDSIIKGFVDECFEIIDSNNIHDVLKKINFADFIKGHMAYRESLFNDVNISPRDSFLEFYKTFKHYSDFHINLIRDWQSGELVFKHERHLGYFECRITTISIHFDRMMTLNNTENSTEKSLVVLLLNREHDELVQALASYSDKIKQGSDTEDLKSYKQGSLKRIYYLLYKWKSLTLFEQIDYNIALKDFKEAKRICAEAEHFVKEMVNYSSASMVSSFHEKTLPCNNNRFLLEISNKKTLLNSYSEDMNLKLKRKVDELEQKIEADKLTIFYGGKTENFTIPFPYKLKKNTIKKPRSTGEIEDRKNLAILSIGLLYSLPAPPGEKAEKRFGYLDININDGEVEFQNLVACSTVAQKTHPYWNSFSKSIVDRVSDGTKIAREFNQSHPDSKLLFVDSSNNTTFSPQLHLHSEQYFFEVLNHMEISDFIEKFISKNSSFTKECKVFAVTFDIESENSSCSTCKVSEIAMQNPKGNPNYFLSKLQTYLKQNNYHLPGEKKGKELLWSATRICAERTYQNNHRNPQERNIKRLENFGIFEDINPTVFASGAEKNLLKK